MKRDDGKLTAKEPKTREAEMEIREWSEVMCFAVQRQLDAGSNPLDAFAGLALATAALAIAHGERFGPASTMKVLNYAEAVSSSIGMVPVAWFKDHLAIVDEAFSVSIAARALKDSNIEERAALAIKTAQKETEAMKQTRTIEQLEAAPPDSILDVTEAATLARVGERAIRAAVDAGELQCRKLGGAAGWRFAKAAVTAWAAGAPAPRSTEGAPDAEA